MEFKEQNSCLATETTWPFRPGVVQKSMKLLAGCWWVPRADKYFTLRIKTQQTWWRCLMYCQAQSICLLFYISSLEKAIAPHSSTLAWKTPWTEEPGGLQSMGSLRVRHDWVTSLSLFTFMHWRRKWQPTPVFLPGESQGQGSLVGCRLWGHTESDTTEVT